MSDDLVERLRRNRSEFNADDREALEAAAELIRLRERNAELEKERDERPWVEKQRSNIMRKMDVELFGWKCQANEQTNQRILAESRISSLEAELDVANKQIAEMGRGRAWTVDGDAQWNATLRDVFAERLRQIEKEGWSPEHDDAHSQGELARAGASYAIGGRFTFSVRDRDEVFTPGAMPAFWPFSVDWWKPKDCRRNLVCAAALIVAEIERLDRAAERLK